MVPMERAVVDQILLPGTPLNQELRRVPGFQPGNDNIWQFAVFTLDPEMKDLNQLFFVVGTYPDKIARMTNDMDFLDAATVERLKKPKSVSAAGLLLGKEIMLKIKKNVGDVFRAKSISHREGTGLRSPIEMDFEIVGEIPLGNQWTQGGFMDQEVLNRVLEDKENEMANRVDFALLQVDDLEAAERVCSLIEENVREVHAETMSAAFARFMEPLKGLLRWMKYVLVPAILVVMTLILANTFSLSVRERMSEMAVLKVLGFGGGHITTLVIGESLLVGALAGLVGAAITHILINVLMGGLPMGQGFGILLVAKSIYWWGPAIGAATGFFGSFLPAWTARRVKVSNVFASVA
jgi:putative ABC transport system permease protein